MDEDLTLRVGLDDEASPGVRGLREDVRALGRDVEGTGKRAGTASGGWDKYGRVAKRALFGVAAAAGVAGYATGRLLKSSLEEASTLNESLNAVSVTYGKQTKAVLGLSRAAAKGLGLSKVEFNSLSVRFSAFAKTVGGGGRKTVKTLDDLTTRAADFASVMNVEVAESAELFQSGLAGETEPLRKYGIDLSAAKVQAYAYAAGIAKSGAELTESQKVQARYGSLMEQTAQTQGDFANTSGELANQQRILGARFDNAKAKLGNGLLPMAKDVVRFLNREGIPAFLEFSDWFTKKGVPAVSDFIEDAKPLANEVLPAMGTALGVVRDALGKAAPYAKDLIGAFNDAPDWVKAAITGGAVGGFAAKKMGLGSLAGKAASIATKAKPLPVWVVNNGDLPGGGTGSKPGSHKGPGRTPWGALGGLTGFAAAAGVGTHYANKGLDKAAGTDNAVTIAGSKGTPGGGMGIPNLFGDDGMDGSRTRAEVDKTYGLIIDNVKNTSAAVRDLNEKIGAGRDRLGLYGTGLGVIADQAVSAKARLDEVRESLLNMPAAGSYGNGLGVLAPTGGGGRGRGKATTSPAFGGKPSPMTAAPITPRASSGGGGVIIGEGAMPITIHNPGSNVDVEVAVANGIRQYVQEREER